MSYSLLLLAILLLSLLILRIIPRRPLHEFFADLKTDPDVQKWMDFQNKEYCPLWNDLMEIAMKNDQADALAEETPPNMEDYSKKVETKVPEKKQLFAADTSKKPLPKIPEEKPLNMADKSKKLAEYSKKVQDDLNKKNGTAITFVVCSPITPEMSFKTLLQLVPEGPQNYLDSLNMINTKMADAIQQVNAALANEGFTPFKREFEYVDNPDTTTTYTSTDGTNITFTTKPKTPEEQKQEADQEQIILVRIKAILKELDKIRAEMKRAIQQKAQLEEIKKKGEDGSLYTSDGSKPSAKEYGPANGRLFFN